MKMVGNESLFLAGTLTPLKKNHPVGLSDTASDTIVRCYVGQACPTGLSDMGLDNSVRCHVEQTWFDGFVQHGIVAEQAGSDLLGRTCSDIFAEQANDLLGEELANSRPACCELAG
ncbi:hypothetical protein PCASD_16773 [Puccinia coronata f. sp. avenae]|uniref:Uncharacterized protein n=1 Tax=Puccinia coronata f. sp. avenae TaxID=200324 RepID=A0A2N5TE78_9BASI|nr:hypothetical protein PCASD_16773 [Puccinia coronata f. sp. avenae]